MWKFEFNFEFQLNNEYFFSLNMSQMLHGHTYTKQHVSQMCHETCLY